MSSQESDNAQISPDKGSADGLGDINIDKRLLELLVCPQTKGPLVFDRQKGELLSKNAGLAYPIRDSIPIMLPDEARPLTDDEMNRL